MEEYRERDKPTATSAKEDEDVALNTWQLMLADFDADLADGQETFNQNAIQQSVQEEYSIYIMGALSAGSTLESAIFLQNSP